MIYRSNCLENKEYWLVYPINVRFGRGAQADVRDSRKNMSGRVGEAM